MLVSKKIRKEIRKMEKKSPKQQQNKKRSTTWSNLWYWFRKLYGVSPGFVWLFLVEVPLTIGIPLLSAYLPSKLVEDITNLSVGGTIETAIVHLVLVGGALAVLYVAQCWIQTTQTKRERKVCFALSQKKADASMATSYANVESPQYQKMFHNITEQITWSSAFTSDFLKQSIAAVSAIFAMILYTSMLSDVSFWILLLIITGAGVNLTFGLFSNRRVKKFEKQCWKLDYEMTYLTRHASSYEVAKDVHLYHMTPWFTKLYDQGLKERMHLTVSQQLCYYWDAHMRHTVRFVWQIVAYIYLISCVCSGTISVADFVFYIGILTEFARMCVNVVRNIRELHKTTLNIEQERELCELMERGCQEGTQELQIPEGHVPEIVFKNVTFQYEGAKEPTIRDLNLTLHSGENIALVGQNGAGKTTFIKLLCGFYDPTEGEILVDGVNRTCYTRKSWMRAMTGVFQDMGFFPMSIGDNLVPENPRETDTLRLWDCLDMADLKERILKLPDGLQTMFGLGVHEGATEFSGGEKQRLMLARSLYKEAPILLLDEPTSALDPLMESELYEQYRKFSQGKTTVFISHRLASTRFCDRILLMENGKIVEEGTHEELVKGQGSYAQMYYVQSKYYQEQQEMEEAFEGTFSSKTDHVSEGVSEHIAGDTLKMVNASDDEMDKVLETGGDKV